VLDIRTLSLTTMLHCGLFAVGLAFYSFTTKRYRGLLRFAAANLCLCVGFLLLGLRGMVSDPISVVAANTLIGAGFLAFHAGSFSFRKVRPAFIPVSAAALLAVVILFIVYTFPYPNINARIIVINAYIGAESALCTYAFVRTALRRRSTQDLAGALAFLIFAVYSVFRIVWTIGEDSLTNFMDAGVVHGLSFIMVQLLSVQSSFVSAWIATSELSKDLETQARLDPLTGALNRRAFRDETDREFVRARRTHSPLSMIIADLDQLKELNDRLGHRAGDLALTAFCRGAQSMLRVHDRMSRLGGDEFAILLPGTTEHDAATVAERIRIHFDGTQIDEANFSISFTVSLGVVAYTAGTNNVEELLRHADAALYRAKARGRNRIEVGVDSSS
jgi:diguanylate cyclase (GGDEF)-like protein